MQVTVSSKGQLVIPAPVRRRLRIRARSKLEIEERDGGLFLRLAQPRPPIAPIEYPPPGTIALESWHYDLDRLADQDAGPEQHRP
jgi:AbrB family looped-hinge helix DNA binding protein